MPHDNRLALITGSSRGIGFALALGLAREGLNVALNARNSPELDEAAERLRSEIAQLGLHNEVHTSAFDVTDERAVIAAIAQLEAKVGAVEVLINNAGIQLRGDLSDMPVDTWRTVIDVNLTGAFVVGREVARHMITRGRGKIVNICSVQSSLVRPTTAPYAASKAGLANLTKVMCAEWARSGLQINGLAPGYVVTELNRALVDDLEFNEWIIKRTPARRWGQVADLVGPAVWLSSSAADFVNGQTIYVDGGMTAVI